MNRLVFDSTGLGSRLRRLSQNLLADVDRAYAATGSEFRARLFPIIYALHRNHGPMTVGELTSISGFTQPATSQTISQLVKAGLVATSTGHDARERQVSLTEAGQRMVDEVQPFWRQIKQAVDGLLAEVEPDFLTALAGVEAAMDRETLFDRIMALQAPPLGTVELVPYAIEHRQAFHDLNMEWIERYFHVEDYDREQLANPERILEKGGEIWFAVLDGKAVGTGALYCKGEGEFEIAKMAVAPGLRGHGIGARLMEKLIQRFRERGGKRLFLVTNSTLKPAIGLYRRFGFVDFVPLKPSEYERSDTFMEWRPA